MTTISSTAQTLPKYDSLATVPREVVIEGTPKCLYVGMIVDGMKRLSGLDVPSKRGPLEQLPDGRWRQYFIAGQLVVEFFWLEKPKGPRFRDDYYARNPDRVVVSRGKYLDPSSEWAITEAEAIEMLHHSIIRD